MPAASKELFPVRGHNNPEVIHFTGRFSLSSSPVVIAGRGYTVTRAPTGLFTVQTAFPWVELVSFCLGVLSSTLNEIAQLVSYNPATRSFVLQYQSAGVASDGTTAKQIGFDLNLAQKSIPLK